MVQSKLQSSLILALLAAPLLHLTWGREGLAHDPDPGEQGARRRELRLPIADFSLTDQHGKAFRFRSLKGRVILLGFVYTSCPDVCPLMTASALSLQRSLREGEKESVALLTITTDPEVDTPTVLKSYAGRFGADFSNWSFLTGDASKLSPVWRAFGVKVERKGRGLIEHTPLTAIVDQRGVLRVAYVGTSPDPERMLRDIRTLLSGLPFARRPDR